MIHTNRSGAAKRRELFIFGSSFLVAFGLNVAGIIQNHAPARELITRFHVVLLVALVIYGAVLLLRVLYSLISRLWIRK